LLFGGYNGSFAQPLGESWLHGFIDIGFGNFGWLSTLPSPSPSPRFGHGTAFYPVSGLDVLFGGQGFSSFTRTTTTPTDTWNGACIGGPVPTGRTSSGPKWTQATPAHNPGPHLYHGMTTGPKGLTVVLFGGSDLPFPRLLSGPFPNGRDHNETWTWGRLVACLPADGSQIGMHSEVNCLFTPAEGISFGGWNVSGFKLVHESDQDADKNEEGEGPDSTDQLSVTFRAKRPGAASITAQWTDAAGAHSQTFNYTILHSHD